MKQLTLLEKAAIILEDMCCHLEMDNIISLEESVKAGKMLYKNQDLGDFTSLAYRLLHAGRTHNKLDSCKHPTWEAEAEKMYRELTGNGDFSKSE